MSRSIVRAHRAIDPRRAARPERATRYVLALAITLVGVTAFSTVVDYAFDRTTAAETAAHAAAVHLARGRVEAVAGADRAARGYVLSQGRQDFLDEYRAELDTLAAGAPAATLAMAQAGWDEAIRLTDTGAAAQAQAALVSPAVVRATAALHASLSAARDLLLAQQDVDAARNDVLSKLLQSMNIGCVLIALVGMAYAFGRIGRAIDGGRAAMAQTDSLFAMADMLQSAAGQDDTNDVLRAAAAQLLPDLGGALYVFNNSRDRLEVATRWGRQAEGSPEFISPASCWALKRGKAHHNRPGPAGLRCGHGHAGTASLEIPMAARGQLHGLLELIADGPGAEAKLEQAMPIAVAMGDAMSLALSSIALRERLRNQALRDSLTGLYNRRFLEEMLDRVGQDAERRRAPFAAIMIDLDHFKKINDTYGHAAGDAVLRDVAGTILSCIRAVDVACRYGGEELAVLLPDCTLAQAVGKAEQIRSRIAAQPTANGVIVTASLGVAGIPETSANVTDMLTMADAALYRAKQQGRDRVVAASVAEPALALVEAAG